MFIDKQEWGKIKELVDNIYWDEDRMSRDGLFFLKSLNKKIKELESNNKNKVYAITSHGVYDDEEYNDLFITPSKEIAQKKLKDDIEKLKQDMDISMAYNYDDIDINDSKYDNKWIFEETDSSFEIYLNGEYNSNHCVISLKEQELLLEEQNNMEIM